MHRTTWRRSFIRRCTIPIIERAGLRRDVVRPGTLIPSDIRHGSKEGERREIRLFSALSGTRHELDNLGAHEQPSQTAMAINPTSASDIKYAVIGFSLEIMCGMIASRSFRARTLSPPGAACGRGFQAPAARRHVRACRLVTFTNRGSDGGTRATPRATGVGRRGVAMCDRRPIQKILTKKPAADFSARA
jgi:hypothetical protein